MRKIVAAIGITVLAATAAWAASTEKWLHVKVDKQGEHGEMVRVNIPLSFAAKLVPAIQTAAMRHGKLHTPNMKLEDVDIQSILAAVRDVPDGEFVTVQSAREDVRVAKEKGYLIVHVKDDNGKSRADVRLPMGVVDAMLPGPNGEIDLMKLFKALEGHGESPLITAVDHNETVSIWVDSKNTSE